MVCFANLDFRGGVGPGFGERAARQLEQDVAAGAAGLKFFKNFGIDVRDRRGARVPVDDPELDPVFETAGRLGIPVLMHVGEPASFYEPVDRFNERWLELTLLPERRLPADRYPSFETMMAERDRRFARHPDTTFIAAHMGWHANDLGRLGALLDRLPNVYAETGAILYELGRQPRTARRVLRAVPGPDSVRQGPLRAGGVPLLLAHVRDRGRVFRLLPAVSRLLADVRHGAARRRAAQGVPPQRARGDPRHRPLAVSGALTAAWHATSSTGGAGFIGSHVVDALAARGDAVRVVDDLSTGRRENLSDQPGLEMIVADLGERRVAEEAVADIDCAIHLAAIPSVPRSVREPRHSHRANVEATHELLLAARDAGVRRVVLASSSSVYGESPTLPKHEGMRPAPLSPYALHKLIGEQYAALFSRLYGLETVALRFFNVFGPRQSPQSQYSGVISLFTAALLAGRAPTIYGDGEQTRDFTYVADVARGVLQACDAPAASGRAVNLARGGRMSVNALYAVLQRATGVSVAARYAEPRRGDVRHSQADISLARDLLGFAPVVPVEAGLERTVDWQRQQAEAGRSGSPGVAEAGA